MANYDADQLKAINSFGGYFLVLAPPGCGKTAILAERIATAKEKGVNFDEMLCLTFTNRAARGMLERIQQRVESDDTKELFVGNIHRYCINFLYENSLISQNTGIIDEDDQIDILQDFNDLYFLNRRADIDKAKIKFVTDLASYITQTQKNHDEKVKPQDPHYPLLFSEAQKCDFDYRKTSNFPLNFALQYLEYKRENNLLDFSDILILAYDAMSKSDEFKKYKWIQVDEIQDLNHLQIAIIDSLTDTNSNFTVMYLGDEQQAIFSFLGAKLEILNELKDRCNCILRLRTNYRAPKYLIDVCNKYAEDELQVPPQLLPIAVDERQKEKFDLILCCSDSEAKERERISKMISYYLGLSDKERLAILVPTNKAADEISESLEQKGINNFKISGTDMFRTKDYKVIASFFSVLVNEFNFMAWNRLLSGLLSDGRRLMSPAKARAFTAQMKELMMTPADLLRQKPSIQRFLEAYNNEEMVYFDTETTGLDVLHDDIVQIAAFKVYKGEKVPGSYLNIILETDKEIPAMLGDKINPLVNEYADRQHLTRKQGLSLFIEYIGDCPVLGHNMVNYDYRILKQNVSDTLNIDINYEVFDSLFIIKTVEPHLRKYKLEYLLSELHLEGENSHLADDDINATKSVVDYCVRKASAVVEKQEEFLQQKNVAAIRSQIQFLAQMMKEIRSYMYCTADIPERSMAIELKTIHDALCQQNLINPLGRKFNIFLDYIAREWTYDSRNDCLFNQIQIHINEITSAITEGDLVNSDSLINDRVFIMTVYKGKGLEFDNVVVLGAVDGTYPFFQCNKILNSPHGHSAAEIEQAKRERKEDSRKFYVALSRAKKRLCISYYSMNQWGYTTELTPFMNSIRNFFHEG